MSGSLNTMEMLRQGARGEFVPPETGQMAVESPAAAPSTTFSVLQMLKQGMRGEFKPETKEAKSRGGLIRNLAAGANEAIFSALGAPVDVGGAVLRGLGLPIGEEPVGGSGWMQSQFGKVSVDPRAVPVDGLGDRIARSTGGGLAGLPLSAVAGAGVAATSGLGPVARAVGSAVANQPVAGSIAPIVGGAMAGSSLSSAAPDWAAPTVDVLGNMAGGGIAAGLEQGGRAAGRKTITAPLGYAGVGPKQTVQGEGGESLRVTRTQMDAARARLSEAVGQSGPDGVQRFTDALQNNPGEKIPGSHPTTAQVAPLPGIAKLENTVRARPEGGPAFMARDEAQNAARVALIQGSKPEGWSPGAVGQAFRDIHDALDVEATKAGVQARGEVAGAVDALGAPKPPDVVGQGVRGAIEPMQTAEKRRIGRLYDAIDPDRTLALPVVDGKQAAIDVVDQISPRLRKMMKPAEIDVLDAVAALPDVATFSDVRQHLSAIGDAQRELGASLGWESTAVRRLTQVKRALENDVGQAAERISDASPDQSITALLQEELRSVRQDGGGPSGGGAGGVAGGRAGGAVEASGVGVQGAGQPENAASYSGMEVGSAGGRTRAPESLIDFQIARGGVRDEGGDLRAGDLQSVHHRAGGRLINPNGERMDYAREAAVEAGFLPPGADINAYRDALRSSTPVYRISEQADGSIRGQHAREGRLTDEARFVAGANVQDAATAVGVRLARSEMEHATDLAMQGMYPEAALREAVAAGDDAILQRNAERNAVGAPGVPLAARQSEMPIGESLPPPLVANFPPEAASQLRSANRQYRDYKETYRRGDVGAILKSGRGGDEFAMSDTAAGQRIVAPEALRAYLAASKDAPEAMTAVQDALISDMRARGAVLPDGTVSASKLKGWQDSRRHSLDQVPEISDKFRTVEAAQMALDDATAVQTARLKEFQNGVARRFLNDEPTDAVARILRSPDRVKGMRDTLAAVGDNPDARASLQGHVVDFIIDRLTSTAKATEANAAAPGIAEVGNLRPDTFRKWVSENKPWLRDLFEGGQGMQNIEMVAADLQRQQMRTQATAGSATAERLAGDKLGIARNYAPTVMALVGEHLASLAAEGAGAHGMVRLGAGAAGAAIPLLAHALHQRGVTTVNALVREAMLHPDIARMLMQRPKDGQVGPVLQRRLAASLLAGSQTRDKEEARQ